MNERSATQVSANRWLLLIHQLPAKPAYLRVKIWRRLQGLGAVAVKNAVYALPATAEAQEDFEWLLREIAQGGGEAIGVFPRSLGRIEVEHRGLTKMHMVDSMHERKQIMYDNAETFVILPGGFGTLDEMFEVLTWRQIKIHQKSIIIFNHEGYWDHLITLMDNIIETGFAKPLNREFYTVVNTREELYKLLGLAG